MGRFPPELEQAILKMCAEDDWSFIPTLLRVAQRTHIWLEPLLYQHVYISTDLERKPAQDAFFHVAVARPQSFLAKSVRVVVLELAHSGTPAQDLLERTYNALRSCTGIQEFAVNGADKMDIGPRLFPILATMPLRRLGAFLENLMPHPIFMKDHAPAFSALTHLDVFDSEGHNSHSRDLIRIVPFLTALPSLTHLALQSQPPAHSVQQILDGCAFLQVLAFMEPSQTLNPYLVPDLLEYLHGLPIRDPRIVVSVYDEWEEVISSYEPSFWTAIDIFLDYRKQGRIDKDRIYTGDFHDEDSTDPTAQLIRQQILDVA
ncbi:hypothetical protein MIND_01421000 [Mycena indigotica]|uniref:Uncharacterized protein n=1 Tax=Mycena indigotica TaxID=2126181 RepID=A0A8H6RXI8_9AGAR|nr:uncharacterized protein MIND_01421000 [Mycena indigotica]KAF7288756.1 hypothetical protein MIND_01421000 [Mycena indigotica]